MTTTMMGLNLHRKLLNHTEDEQSGTIIPKTCDIFCDAKQNPLGLCPPLCVNFCDQVCKDPPPLPLLPQAPAPITVTPIISHAKHFSLALFLEIILAILVTGFLFLTCYAIYKLCMKWRRSRTSRTSLSREITRDRDTGGEFLYEDDYGPVLDHPIWYIRTIGLQPSVINSISIVRFKKGDGLVEGTDCSICLTEFDEDESIRLLPKCSHAFHVPCIDTWLRSHTNCPMCRAPIVNNSGIVVPPQEIVIENSSGSDGAREGGSNNSDGGIRNELLENETAIGISERDERTQGSSDRVCFKVVNGEQGCNDGDGIQPMQRSVSSVSLSACRMSAGMIDALSGKSDINGKLVEDKESSSSVNKNIVGSNSVSVRCSSMERSVQRENCSSVKRSASCMFLSRK